MTDLNSHFSMTEEQAKKNQEKPLIQNSIYKNKLQFIEREIRNNIKIPSQYINIRNNEICNTFSQSKPKINKIVRNEQFTNFLKIAYKSKSLQHYSASLYLPANSFVPIRKNVYLLQTWNFIYIIDEQLGQINATFIRHNIKENGLVYQKAKLLFDKLIIFTFGNLLFIYIVDDLSFRYQFVFTNYLQLYPMNHGHWLVNYHMEIIKFDEELNPFIELSLDYLDDSVACSQSELLSKENFPNKKKYCAFNLINKTYKVLSRKDYYIYKNKDNRGGYILKSSPVFKLLSFKVTKEYLYNIESDRNIFGVLKDRVLYICDVHNILYSFDYPSDCIHSIKESNNKFYIHSKRALFIYDSITKQLKCLWNEQIQYDILRYKGRYYYIVISPIWIKLIDLYTNEVFKYIEWNITQPIKRVISAKGHLLVILSFIGNRITIWDINTESCINSFYIPSFPKLNRLTFFEEESPFQFKMLTNSIVYLEVNYYDNIYFPISNSLIIDLDENKLTLLNAKMNILTILSNQLAFVSCDHYISLYKYPFTSILEEEFIGIDYLCTFAQELLNKNILLYIFGFGYKQLKLYERKSHKMVKLSSVIKVNIEKIFHCQVVSAFEYKPNIVLIKEGDSFSEIDNFSHVYALDFNEYKFLYQIDPYGDNRYCFIFEPLKRMNVALSFDLAYLEIWNLESVQCNTKIFMFETQRVFELDNCQLVLMCKRGIRVVNAKY